MGAMHMPPTCMVRPLPCIPASKSLKVGTKVAYGAKLCQLLDKYTQILIAAADNVDSNLLQNIRQGLQGDSVVLTGKCGLIFTKDDWKEVSEEVAKHKVGAPARVDLVAPIDVVVPPGNTGLGPSQTSCFQVLNISTKINKEIITPVELIKKGEKVDSSEAALLAKLGISPFSYGFVVLSGYDNGLVFNPKHH